MERASPPWSVGRLRRQGDIILRAFRGLQNPFPFLADMANWTKSEYEVRLRDGLRVRLMAGTFECAGLYDGLLRRDYLSRGIRLRPGDTVIDVGANIGCFSLFAARLVGPRGRVIAVEPDAAAYARLCANIRLNTFENITPRNIALSDHAGTVPFHRSYHSVLSSLYEIVNGYLVDGQIQHVQGVTLPALLREQHLDQVDLLKVDCEGAEHQLFRALTAQDATRIRQMTAEIHEVPGDTLRQLRETLSALGFRVSEVHTPLNPSPLWYARR